ncbi:MAG TPA: glucose 1-dehydrogenase [Thermoanaerobaculia bacterium]|nr:glucose 1-dehydrogenase [Thermoanaerobaculia bacterium]
MSESRPAIPPPPRFDLTGRVALVTGSSRGIGRAIAHAYAAAGARVALASRKQEDLEAVAAEIAEAGGEALALACHTGRPEEVANLVATIEERWGGVDVLVNNAATNPHFGPLVEAEEWHWDKTFEVNVKGYFHLARACVPSMRRRGGGSIVNVASVAGQVPYRGLGVYSVSKAAVLMLTKVLANELAGDGIRVNALAPGLIETRFSVALWNDPAVRERVLATIPQRRIGQPEELTGLALYLACEASSYTTGGVFFVDGGESVGGGG